MVRHIGLIWFAGAGVHVHVLRRIAGHGSPTTTQRSPLRRAARTTMTSEPDRHDPLTSVKDAGPQLVRK